MIRSERSAPTTPGHDGERRDDPVVRAVDEIGEVVADQPRVLREAREPASSARRSRASSPTCRNTALPTSTHSERNQRERRRRDASSEASRRTVPSGLVQDRQVDGDEHDGGETGRRSRRDRGCEAPARQHGRASAARRRARARRRRPSRRPSSVPRRRRRSVRRGTPREPQGPRGRRSRRAPPRPRWEQPVSAFGRAAHRVGSRRVARERDCRQSVGEDVDEQHLDDRHRRAEARRNRDGEQGDLAQVRGEQEGDELPDVVGDRPSFSDRGDDRREVVVREDEVGRLACRLGARPPHGDADVGPAKRGRVVDAVAGDRDDLALGLPATRRAGASPQA